MACKRSGVRVPVSPPITAHTCRAVFICYNIAMPRSLTSKGNVVTTWLNTPLGRIVTAGIIVLVIAVWGWWHYVYSSPANTFDRMLSTMLSTYSVTKHTEEGSAASGQSLDQTVQLITTPAHQVQGRNIVNQGDTQITTENIGTSKFDYVRYTDIQTAQKNSKGNNFDFSSVLNIWGVSEMHPDTATGQLYGQNIFGVVPIGNLSGTQRRILLDEIDGKDIYKVDYAKLKHEMRNGRPTYTYNVTVDAVPYVQMLKNFARTIGVIQLEQVDPNQYKDTPALTFQMVVDVWSAELLEVQFSDSGRIERYDSYGASTLMPEPTDTIPVIELQTRLQSLN
jgi:hypothetical protein